MTSSTSQNLTERTANQIFQMIIADPGFTPGEKLPSEHELCLMLGVSRTTVRAAIRSLSVQGYVDVKQGHGTFVTENNTIRGNIGLGQLELVRVRLKDLFEMRMMFEPHIAALACQRASEEELSHIIACAEEVARLIKEGGDWAEADIDYHAAVVSASHNQFMEQLIPIINKACKDTWTMRGSNPDLPDTVLRDNLIMIDFLQRGDVQGCKYAMATHIRHIIDMIGFDRDDFIWL